MTDLSIQSFPGEAASDYSWLAGDSGAFQNAQSATLKVSTLTAGTHYDAVTGVAPSGLALVEDGATYKPWNPAADPAEVVAGFLAHAIPVRRENGQLSANVACAIVVDAVINKNRLPVPAQRVFARTTATSGKFVVR